MATKEVNMHFSANNPDMPPFYKSIIRILSTTDHREIGLMYIAFALLNLIIAGLLALLIRLQLAGIEVTNANGYTQLFTMHGSGMIFLVILPLGVGLGNYLVPIMIGATDVYWPKFNNIGFWMLIPGSIFFWFGFSGTGWTAYPPLSVIFAPVNTEILGISLGNVGDVDLWLIGILIIGTSSIIGAVNFVLTIWKMRAPEVKYSNMNLFVWATLINSVIQIIATPILTIGLVMLLFDRNLGTMFFSGLPPGDPLLFQNVFWFYSHPAVYLMVLPAFGLISNIIPAFSRTKIFGYTSMVASMVMISFLGLVVWGHHMYTTGLNVATITTFFVLTYIIALPSGIKMFNWIFTMANGHIKFELPMMFAMLFLLSFLIGGLTGVILNVLPFQVITHDTTWVVGHFHFIVYGGTLAAIVGALYYYFPFITGRMLNSKLGWWSFWTFATGNFLTFGPMAIAGILGMNRRYFRPPEEYLELNQLATVGAGIIGIAVTIFFINFLYSWIKGPKADADPWKLAELPTAPVVADTVSAD
ncbi:MAG: Cytochrome c oxidase polypeptide 1 [Candidatus Heimdallarchaeota archaeon LC_3]|nr:MAG: Cytochrome c oxidase polypeptide 1 [Candidatus Heimdallarchaeota archaeon LC_3]